MPWLYCTCPDGAKVAFPECLACTRECLDLEVREALFDHEANQDPSHTGSNISVTALLGCLRANYLERITPYAATPESRWYSLRGDLIHRLLERNNGDSTRLCETTLEATLGGVKLTGRIDAYQQTFLRRGILKDWKSIGDNGLQYIVYEGAKQDHIWQTNIYAWLARQNGYPVTSIQIAYLSLMQIVKTGTVTRFYEYLKQPPGRSGKRASMIAPPTQVKTYPSGMSKWLCYYQVPSVPLYDHIVIEEFLVERLLTMERAFQTGAIPPMADSETRKWKCEDYCHVNALCAQIEGKE